MKTLITGSTGFVGQAVLKELTAYGLSEELVLLSSRKNDNYPTCIYQIDGDRYTWNIPQDVDCLIHIGAWTPKSVKNFQDADKGFGNITFTRSLLHSLPNLKRLVFISTIDVYAPTKEPINEDSLVQPISIYGYSKLYCEEMVKAWSEQHNINCCVLRLGHIYGVGEAAYKKLIPMLIQQALKGETINIYSAGNELRSFLNIEDCAKVIVQAGKSDVSGLFNVVSGNPVSVKQIAKAIKRLTGSNSEIVIQNRPVETRDMVFDNSRLLETFPLKEKSLEQGLMEEINYFKNLAV